MTFIKKVFTENTGGGCMVDFYELADGRMVGLNDECIVLYPSAKSFYEGDADGNYNFPAIWREAHPDIFETPKIGTYTEALLSEYTFDLLVLATGEALGVDSEAICLYANKDEAFDAAPDSVIASISL